MQSQRARRAATVPMFLRRLHTDEYPALPYTSADVRVLRDTSTNGLAVAERLGLAAPSYGASALATANGLSALNKEWGANFYKVSAESMADEAAAAAMFHAPGPVVDVQTHFLGDELGQVGRPAAFDGYRKLMPDWWRGFEGLPD